MSLYLGLARACDTFYSDYDSAENNHESAHVDPEYSRLTHWLLEVRRDVMI